MRSFVERGGKMSAAIFADLRRVSWRIGENHGGLGERSSSISFDYLAGAQHLVLRGVNTLREYSYTFWQLHDETNPDYVRHRIW